MKAVTKGCAVTATAALLALACAACAGPALAHGFSGRDAAYVAANRGAQVLPFVYLGAKHMVTGYDHLLFLFGVVFFLYRLRDVALYVTTFSAGHSLTLLAGVIWNVRIDPFLIDALIGLSVAYKAFDNLGGFGAVFGIAPDPKLAVFAFGLAHGFGLATKLQALRPSADGLLLNIVSFNVGVEIGQLLALSAIVALVAWWRTRPSFARLSAGANTLLLGAGFLLAETQVVGFFMAGA